MGLEADIPGGRRSESTMRQRRHRDRTAAGTGAAGESGIAEADGRRLFVESLKQPAHLVICGAGHVAQQVILLAGKLDLR